MATKTLQGKLGAKKPGKFQSIPQQQSADPTIDAISENLLQLTGQRGTGGKKAVLWEDLEKLGVANLNGGNSQLKPGFGHGGGGGNNGGGGTNPPEFELPTQPINVVGKAGFGMATLTWDTATYKGHAYTEIFQGDVDVFAQSIRIGTTPADIFTVSTDLDADKYYWIRFVNIVGNRGPINDTNGIHIVSVKDPQYLIDLINSQIPDLDDYLTENELDNELSEYVKTDLLDRLDVLLAESSLENSVTIDEQSSEAKVGTATLRATIKNEYYTIVRADEAMAAAVQTVKSEIEDPNGSSLGATVKNSYVSNATFTQAQAQLKQELQSNIDGVSSSLANDYYTKVESDTAIAQAKTELTSDLDGVKANLSNNYLTEVETNTAISQATQSLQSNIDGLSSNLSTNYYTKTTTDDEISKAVSQAKTELNSNIDNLESKINQEMYTKTETDGNISTAVNAINTSLSSKITAVDNKADSTNSSLSTLTASLNNDYYTKTQTDGYVTSSISNATQTLQSSIDGVDSKVTTVSNTVANNQGEFEALWGVNASVGDATASIGLVAKTNGAGINDSYFFVKDADFKVLYSDGDTNQQAAIFGTIVDPNNPSKRVLSIDTTYINAANIKDIVSGSITADSIVAGSEIHTPVLRSPTINTSGSNFYVNSAGIVSMKGATVSGNITATSGTLNNVRIKDTCVIEGKLKASQIDGDIVKAYPLNINATGVMTKPFWVYSITIPASDFNREVQFPVFNIASLSSSIEYYVDNVKVYSAVVASFGQHTTVPYYTRVGARSSPVLKIKVVPASGGNAQIIASRSVAIAFKS